MSRHEVQVVDQVAFVDDDPIPVLEGCSQYEAAIYTVATMAAAAGGEPVAVAAWDEVNGDTDLIVWPDGRAEFAASARSVEEDEPLVSGEMFAMTRASGSELNNPWAVGAMPAAVAAALAARFAPPAPEPVIEDQEPVAADQPVRSRRSARGVMVAAGVLLLIAAAVGAALLGADAEESDKGPVAEPSRSAPVVSPSSVPAVVPAPDPAPRTVKAIALKSVGEVMIRVTATRLPVKATVVLRPGAGKKVTRTVVLRRPGQVVKVPGLAPGLWSWSVTVVDGPAKKGRVRVLAPRVVKPPPPPKSTWSPPPSPPPAVSPAPVKPPKPTKPKGPRGPSKPFDPDDHRKATGR